MSRRLTYSQVRWLSIMFPCQLTVSVAAVMILRQFRCKLVQTWQQYVFVHQVLIDAIANQV